MITMCLIVTILLVLGLIAWVITVESHLTSNAQNHTEHNNIYGHNNYDGKDKDSYHHHAYNGYNYNRGYNNSKGYHASGYSNW